MTRSPPDTLIVEFVHALAKADARRDRLREASPPAESSPGDPAKAPPPKRARRAAQKAGQDYTAMWTLSAPTKPTGLC